MFLFLGRFEAQIVHRKIVLLISFLFRFFLDASTHLYKRLCPSIGRSVGRLVGRSVEVIESKSGKTRISAPAHPSATGGRVSGLVPSLDKVSAS